MRERPAVVLLHGGLGSFDHTYFKLEFAQLEVSEVSAEFGFGLFIGYDIGKLNLLNDAYP